MIKQSILFLVFSSLMLFSCVNNVNDDIESRKETQIPKTKIELVNDHNVQMIEDQYKLKMLTKKLDFYLHNFERKSSIEKEWSKEFSYIINKNYIAQTKNEISKSKNSLQVSKEKWQNLTNIIDTTNNIQNEKLVVIKRLLDELENEIESATTGLSRQ